MSKPICVRSRALQVCQDELITELLRGMPIDNDETLAAILYSACKSARKRLGQDRHNLYKCQLFFRHMAERLPNIPPSLASLVGLPGQEEMFEDLVQEAAPVNPSLAPTVRIGPKICLCGPDGKPGLLPCPAHAQPIVNPWDAVFEKLGKVPPAEQSKAFNDMVAAMAEDPFVTMLHMPSFEDYAAVFDKWPFAKDMKDPHTDERVLVLGYVSGRSREGDLVRRNCEYLPEHKGGPRLLFKEIQSTVGLLKKRLPNGNRLHIKVVPYKILSRIRFWTNVKGKGDDLSACRYLFCCKDGIKIVSARDSLEEGYVQHAVPMN